MIVKLVVILGAGAVGKMTVGQELAKITGLRLFHNHMSMEILFEVFGFVPRGLPHRLRKLFFEEFVKTDLEGMIFTYLPAFDSEIDMEALDSLVDIFRREGAEVCYVELVAPQEVRLWRNATENRLLHKASKRDVDASNVRLLGEDSNYRTVSNDGEVVFENYVKIDNSELPPNVVAKMIKDRFVL